MFSVITQSSRAFRRSALLQYRLYSTPSAASDLRTRLKDAIKTAMKSKDSFASITLRSVLSEVHAADKVNGDASQATVVGILRKAVHRRSVAAEKFQEASRSDLAENELREAELLSQFLPTMLTQEEIDAKLNKAIGAVGAGHDSRKALGPVLKEFFAHVDQSYIDHLAVRKRAEEFLSLLTPK